MLIYGIIAWDNDLLKIIFMFGLLIFEIIQVTYCVVLYIQVKNNEFESYFVLYMSYYTITIIMLMLASGFDIFKMNVRTVVDVCVVSQS